MQNITTLPPCPPRPADAHKGTFGTVIVVGGSRTMLGAPALCASAACRAGVGLVKVCTPAEVLPFVLTIEPSATGVVMGDVAGTLAALDQADPQRRAVLAIGPGLGQSDDARQLVLALLDGPRAIVLDADGLNALAASGRRLQRPAATVLTPHPGEFARLARPLNLTASATDPAQRLDAAAALAKAHHAVMVLKGSQSIITDGTRCHVNQTGNPALATAGSGDVLTGVIAALLAQGMNALDAASLGAHVHGAAADLWQKQHGPSGLAARDLATLIPDAMHALRT